MNGAVKAGWFLIGLGAGILGTTIIFKRELDKPIGEIETYVPLEDRDNTLKEDNGADISDNGAEGSPNNREHSQDISNSQKSVSGSRGSNAGRGQQSKPGNLHGRPGSGFNREENHAEFSSAQNAILDYYKSSDGHGEESSGRLEADKRRKEFKERRGEFAGQRTKYSRIYKEKAVEQALRAENSHRGSRNSYEIQDAEDEDIYEEYPSDDGYIVTPVDEHDPHDEYVLERVEENIEVYLDDNPQDFSTLLFYEGDNTLCDDGDEIVPNAEEVVGLAALSRLIQGGPGAENGVIFVRNLRTSLNYEVVLVAGSYSDTVRGQFESHLIKDGGLGGNS